MAPRCNTVQFDSETSISGWFNVAQCKRSERRAATSPFAFLERSPLRHRWQARSLAQVDSRVRGMYCKGIAMAAASVDKRHGGEREAMQCVQREHNNGPCVVTSGLQR
jgi:hypothetical protein